MKTSLFSKIKLGIVVVLAGFSMSAFADFDMNVGLLKDNADAQAKCPAACKLSWYSATWSNKTQSGGQKVALCGAINDVQVSPGPYKLQGAIVAAYVNKNDEAKPHCEAAISKISWNGNWAPTATPLRTGGNMHVCGCKGGTFSKW